MCLRRTKRRNSDGSEVRYYQLAENVWGAARGCAVGKVVYDFGRADQVDGAMLKRLAASILRVTRDGTAAPRVLAADGGPPGQARDAWPYGGVYVLEQLWRETGIDRVLREHSRSAKTRDAFERAWFAMVANRALSPCSKLYCWEQWLREEVFLPSAASLDLHHPDSDQACWFSD